MAIKIIWRHSRKRKTIPKTLVAVIVIYIISFNNARVSYLTMHWRPPYACYFINSPVILGFWLVLIATWIILMSFDR